MKISSKIRNLKFVIYMFLGKFIPYFDNMKTIEKYELRDYLIKDLSMFIIGNYDRNTFKIKDVLCTYPKNIKIDPYIMQISIEYEKKTFIIEIQYYRGDRRIEYDIHFNQNIRYGKQLTYINSFYDKFAETEKIIGERIAWTKY